MFKKTQICTALALAFGSGLFFGVSPAVAQDVPQRVEVTGSRILSPNAESPSPLQIITSREIMESGATNVQQLLLQNPTMGGAPTFSRTNSNFDTSNSGVAVIDLRNLGEERTLVLVNGKRFVAGVAGSSAVDLNSIPTDFIERIEILTGGASSMYGSDAVAGVVNIILKHDFQGLTLDARTGRSTYGDNKEHKISLTFGANADGGKGNVMAYFGATKQGSVYSRDRDGLAIDNISNAALTGDAADQFSYKTPFYSSFSPKGRFFVNPGNSTKSYTVQADGSIKPFSTNGPAGDGVNADGFNRQGQRTIAIPTDRYLFAAKGDYEVADGHRAYLEGTYSTVSTHSRLEPFPLSADGTSGIYPATGQVPAEFLVNGALVRNPVVPDAIYNQLQKTDATGAKVFGFSRRLSEVGDRGSDANSDTFRIATGVKGSFALAGAWDYDVYGSYGFSRRHQTSGGQVNVQNFRNALEAVPDTNDLNGNGNVTEPICRDAEARAQGCVPVNIFGAGSMSAAAIKYVSAPSMLSTMVTQQFYGATVSGEPMMLPAGPLGVAFGAEYRKESSLSEFDSLTQLGLNASNAIPKTEGSYDVTELFGEVRLPLLKDAAFAKALSLSGAVRGSDYSTVGTTVSWNGGVEWALNSDVKFRGTRALAIRAPNIGELYQAPSQTFPSVKDPCLGVSASATGVTADRCRAAAGVSDNIAANGSFSLSQADLQGTSGYDRGNPDLKEEHGWTTTLGMVITPTSIPQLRKWTFTADYFDIKIDRAIVSTPRQFILDQCYSGDATFCSFIKRRAAAVGANSAGSLEFVDSAVTNSGGITTEGVDLTAGYSDKVGPGTLSTRLSWTYLMKGYVVPLPGSAKDEFAGEIGSPKNKALLSLGYSSGPFAVNGQFSFIGESAIDDQYLKGLCNAFDGDGNCTSPTKAGSIKIPSKTYTDMQGSYTFGKVQYYIGVDNLFNTKARICDTNSLNNSDTICATGTGTAAAYDAIGRRYYIGLRMSL
jgi:outer membrane receptor protein involved in Fe transport